MSRLKKLSKQHELFAKEYLQDLNATQAAIRAGYSEKTAGSKGFDLINDPLVSGLIDKLKSERCERLDVDADYVLKQLVEIHEMDVVDILDDQGGLKPVSGWPQIWRRMISGLDIAEIGGDKNTPLTILKKIKWPDKVKNLELLGKHVKVQAFKDKIEHEGDLKNAVPVINLTLSNGS